MVLPKLIIKAHFKQPFPEVETSHTPSSKCGRVAQCCLCVERTPKLDSKLPLVCKTECECV